MSRTHHEGPVSGTYNHSSFRPAALGVSGADQLLATMTFRQAARILAIYIRTLNTGTGTLTAHKVRRAAAGATVVTVAGTQMLSADGGAIAANAQNSIEPTGTTPTLLAAQRDFAKGQQIGVFGSTDGGTTNQVLVDILWTSVGDVLASEAND